MLLPVVRREDMLRHAVRPQLSGGRNRMAFAFRLEDANGTPAEPSTLESAVPNWSIGDEIPLGSRTLRVVGKRDDDADQPPVLIVEDTAA
jgi:hypothetical protein